MKVEPARMQYPKAFLTMAEPRWRAVARKALARPGVFVVNRRLRARGMLIAFRYYSGAFDTVYAKTLKGMKMVVAKFSVVNPARPRSTGKWIARAARRNDKPSTAAWSKRSGVITVHAHATKTPGYFTMEVWRGRGRIYHSELPTKLAVLKRHAASWLSGAPRSMRNAGSPGRPAPRGSRRAGLYAALDKVAYAYYGPGTYAQAKAYVDYNNRAEPGVWDVVAYERVSAPGAKFLRRGDLGGNPGRARRRNALFPPGSRMRLVPRDYPPGAAVDASLRAKRPGRKLGKVEAAAFELGLAVGVSAPGDGITRYRVFDPKSADSSRKGDATVGSPYASYQAGDGLFTAPGRAEALRLLSAFARGRGNPCGSRRAGSPRTGRL